MVGTITFLLDSSMNNKSNNSGRFHGIYISIPFGKLKASYVVSIREWKGANIT